MLILDSRLSTPPDTNTCRYCRTGKVDYPKALDMTKYAKAETEYVVLSRILSEVLTAGDKVRSDETAYGKFWVRFDLK